MNQCYVLLAGINSYNFLPHNVMVLSLLDSSRLLAKTFIPFVAEAAFFTYYYFGERNSIRYFGFSFSALSWRNKGYVAGWFVWKVFNQVSILIHQTFKLKEYTILKLMVRVSVIFGTGLICSLCGQRVMVCGSLYYIMFIFINYAICSVIKFKSWPNQVALIFVVSGKNYQLKLTCVNRWILLKYRLRLFVCIGCILGPQNQPNVLC